jgi:hypothetical protein
MEDGSRDITLAANPTTSTVHWSVIASHSELLFTYTRSRGTEAKEATIVAGETGRDQGGGVLGARILQRRRMPRTSWARSHTTNWCTTLRSLHGGLVINISELHIGSMIADNSNNLAGSYLQIGSVGCKTRRRTSVCGRAQDVVDLRRRCQLAQVTLMIVVP